jgi:AraC family transcriptional regulator
MDTTERIQKAVDYIEERLFEPIDLQDVAGRAFFSPYYFYRLFQAMAGYSLKEYIRRRRFSEASEMLRTTEIGILELAFLCQYESQEAFTRAFKKETGRNPGDFRNRKASFRTFLPVDVVHNQLKGELDMVAIEPNIVKKAEFLVIGPAIKCTIEDEENIKRIPLFWEEEMAKNTLDKIPNAVNPTTCYGVCMDFESPKFTYMIAKEVSSLDDVPDDMIGRTVPAATYAVFTARGPCTKAIQDTTRYIYSTWLPESGYEHAMTADLEVYDERCSDDDTSEVDIYIPIVKSETT